MDTVKIEPPMPDANHCPQCGTPLPRGALAGLCPACLLKLGAADGKAKLFEQLKIFLTAGKGALPYTTAAQTLGLDEPAVRVAVHRLRKRYRELLRAEIAQTLSDPTQVDEEMRALFSAFSG